MRGDDGTTDPSRDQQPAASEAPTDAARAPSIADWERRAFEAMDHPAMLLDRDGTIASANRAARRAYGDNRFQLEGAKCHELLCGQSEPPACCPVAALFTTPSDLPEPRNVQTRGRTFAVRCTPLTDEAGTVAYVVHSAVDVTEQTQQLQALQRIEERYQLLARHIADTIVVATLGLEWLWVSDSVERLRGYTAAETMAQPLAEVLTPRSLRTAKATLSQELLKEQTEDPAAFQPYEMDLEFTRKDGTTVWAELKLTFTRDEEGTPTGIVGLARDITERRLAQAERESLEGQLHRAQRMEAVGRLAGGIAHDFNNMLSVVLGYTALLRADAPPDGDAAADLDEIDRAIDRASKLTQQLLTFSRRQISSPTALNLNDVVSDTERMLSRVVGEDIVLRTELADDLAPVLADRSHVEQVLANLAVNARDALPRGGHLTMRTANVEIDEAEARKILDLEPGAYVRLEVTDDGMGMPPSVLERIFEPFYTTKQDGKGTGVGLSTVYGIVKHSGGHVFAESAPKQGTTFSIYFPKLNPNARISVPPSGPAGRPAPGSTVLVVEDEAPLRKLIRRTLEQQGHRVVEADRAEAALLVAEQHQGTIDVLLTDLILPGPSGKVLAEQLLAARPGLRVVYMSGYSDEIVVEHGMLDEGIVFLPKPFGPAALAAKLAEALER